MCAGVHTHTQAVEPARAHNLTHSTFQLPADIQQYDAFGEVKFDTVCDIAAFHRDVLAA